MRNGVHPSESPGSRSPPTGEPSAGIVAKNVTCSGNAPVPIGDNPRTPSYRDTSPVRSNNAFCWLQTDNQPCLPSDRWSQPSQPMTPRKQTPIFPVPIHNRFQIFGQETDSEDYIEEPWECSMPVTATTGSLDDQVGRGAM